MTKLGCDYEVFVNLLSISQQSKKTLYAEWKKNLRKS